MNLLTFCGERGFYFHVFQCSSPSSYLFLSCAWSYSGLGFQAADRISHLRQPYYVYIHRWRCKCICPPVLMVSGTGFGAFIGRYWEDWVEVWGCKYSTYPSFQTPSSLINSLLWVVAFPCRTAPLVLTDDLFLLWNGNLKHIVIENLIHTTTTAPPLPFPATILYLVSHSSPSTSARILILLLFPSQFVANLLEVLFASRAAWVLLCFIFILSFCVSVCGVRTSDGFAPAVRVWTDGLCVRIGKDVFL